MLSLAHYFFLKEQLRIFHVFVFNICGGNQSGLRCCMSTWTVKAVKIGEKIRPSTKMYIPCLVSNEPSVDTHTLMSYCVDKNDELCDISV